MKLKTNILLLIATIIIALVFLVATFWDALGLTSKETPILAIVLMLSFGLNIAGLIFSFTERKIDRKNATFGTIGNSVLIILFLAITVYSISTMPQ